MPIQRIKIHRSFVRDVSIDAKDAAIVTALIGLAHSLVLMVTAEGVEKSAQRDFLEAHNVDLLQGFLLGKPVPALEIDAPFVERSRKLALVHRRKG